MRKERERRRSERRLGDHLGERRCNDRDLRLDRERLERRIDLERRGERDLRGLLDEPRL